MTDEWDSDCENALEDLCQEVANGDEARALLALLPAVRASLAVAFKAGRLDGMTEAQMAYESARLDATSEHPTTGR